MKILTTTFILLMLTTQSIGQIPQKEAIDEIFKAWHQPNSPGCALGIVQNGELIYARGYGMANLEYDIPNSSNSVFRIASTSKQFTAACILLLAEKGKLKLDDSLDKFFPNFPTYAKKVTVRHLVHHTSGIRDYLTLGYLKGLGNDDFYTDENVMKWLLRQEELNFEPGDEHLYSNAGYWLLGQIVNKVAGINMADFAEKEIFEPLGMTNTHFHNDHNRIVKNRATGYYPKRDGGYEISMTTLNMIGDGGIFTTIEDMKKWDDAFYDSKVLSSNFWKMMTTQGVLNDGEILEYAAGLAVSEHQGLKTIDHGGAFVGFRAQMLRFPDERFSVFIFTNRGDANPSAMSYDVADIFLKEKYKNDQANNSNTPSTKNRKPISLTTNQLKKFEGDYWNAKSGYSRKIYVENDTLRYFRNPQRISDIVPVSGNEFTMLDVPSDIIVRFEKNKNNTLTMVFISNGNTLATSVSYQPKEHSKSELENFVGKYYSKELDVNYFLKMRNDELFLFIDDTEVTGLESVMGNILSGGLGVLEFEKNKSGKVTSFRLAAGRVKNLKFEKR